MRVDEFEEAVFKIEKIRLRVRAPVEEVVGDYDYKNWASQTTSLSNWWKTRIAPKIDGRQGSVIDGNYLEAHGNTLLSTLRSSYK